MGAGCTGGLSMPEHSTAWEYCFQPEILTAAARRCCGCGLAADLADPLQQRWDGLPECEQHAFLSLASRTPSCKAGPGHVSLGQGLTVASACLAAAAKGDPLQAQVASGTALPSACLLVPVGQGGWLEWVLP